jgi:ABC-2 type transport system permease protein
MHNLLALAKRILQQFRHDKRTVVLFIAAPIIALWLFSMILDNQNYIPKLAGVDLPEEVASTLKEQDATLVEVSAAEADEMLASREVDAIISIEDQIMMVRVEGADSSKTGAVTAVVQTALQEVIAGRGADIEVSYLHGNEDWGFFDYFGPVFIGIFIFIFVFLTSGMSLVTERTGGTMERLFVTPIKSWQLVGGYSLGFGVVSLVQAGIVLWAAISLIGFPNEGNIGLVILTTFSMALVSLTLGLLVSALAKSGFQVIQLMVLFVVPQILLSGIFDLSQAPEWMQVLSACFPISHGANALRDVMLRGAAFDQMLPELLVLWGFIIAFFLLATLSFNRQRSR